MEGVVRYSDGGSEGILLLVLIGLAAGGVLLLFWWMARATRRRFTCPSCGEVVVVEQMGAKRCPTCGTRLGGGQGT